MTQWEKTLDKVMSGQADANISFDDLCTMLPHVGYHERRQRGGSHRIFKHPDRPEKMNVQPLKSGKAKPLGDWLPADMTVEGREQFAAIVVTSKKISDAAVERVSDASGFISFDPTQGMFHRVAHDPQRWFSCEM